MFSAQEALVVGLRQKIYPMLLKSKHFNSGNNVWRFYSSSNEVKRQSELFDLEKKRQQESVGRVEKIEVSVAGQSESESTVVVMNKNISTPYDCAKHISELHVNRSVVALINGETLWHMHKPLPDSCSIDLLHFNIPQPAQVNKIFWRTCCFLLGSLASTAFKDKINAQLHSFPSPNVRSGSFVYDVQLSLDDWKPTVAELKSLSLQMIKFCQQDHKIECLDVSANYALDMFQNNPHKTKQIPDIASQNNGKVTVFRVNDHVDISRGPMIPNTSQVGRISVTNVIKLDSDIPGGPIYRFQGVALPKCIVLNHFAYSLLEERAKNLNSARVPGTAIASIEDINPVQAVI